MYLHGDIIATATHKQQSWTVFIFVNKFLANEFLFCAGTHKLKRKFHSSNLFYYCHLYIDVNCGQHVQFIHARIGKKKLLPTTQGTLNRNGFWFGSKRCFIISIQPIVCIDWNDWCYPEYTEWMVLALPPYHLSIRCRNFSMEMAIFGVSVSHRPGNNVLSSDAGHVLEHFVLKLSSFIQLNWHFHEIVWT